MAALMVFTCAPLTGITALAAVNSNGVVSEYLTSSTKDGFSGTAVWDNTMKAWAFDGDDYLKLDDAPLSNASVSNGFAVSFDVYHNDTDESLGQYFHFNDSGSNAYLMNAADTTWYWRYRSAFQNSSNIREYYTSDFNADYCTYWVPTNGANGYMNDMVSEGKWYRFTLVMNTNGAYEYYIDGVLKATYKTNYGSLTNGHGITDANVTSIVDALADYYIGAANGSGSNGFKGYIKNFKFIDGITSGSAGQLALLLDQYEARMGSNTVYKNLAPAYKAYVDAYEAYDAAVYGNSSTAQISAAYTALNTALANMTEWTAQTPANTYNRAFTNDSVDLEYAYHNLLWLQTNYNPSDGDSGGYRAAATGSGDSYAKSHLYYPEATMFYAGASSLPTLAMIISPYCDRSTSTISSKSCTRYAITAFTTTSNITLVNTKWKGEIGNNYDATWGIASGTSSFNATNDSATNFSTSDTRRVRNNRSNSTYRFANYIRYTGSMSDSVAYYTITPAFTMYYNSANSWKTDDGENNYLTGDTDIHVINYARLVNKINSYDGSAFGVKISDYKENKANASNHTVADFFTAFDAMTDYNVNSYFTSSNNWNECQSAMTSVINGMNNQSITADTNGYNALRAAIDLSGSPTGLAGTVLAGNTYSIRQLIADNGYVDTDNNGTLDTQLTGFSTLQTAYANATGVMAALGTANYNTNLTSNYTDSTAAAKATALTSAFNDLSLVSVNAPSVSGNTYLGPNDVITVTDTNSGDATYAWEYSSDNGTTWTNGGSVSMSGSTGTFAPFGVLAAGTYLIRVSATVDSATEYDNANGVTHTYFSAPTVKINNVEALNNQVVAANTTVNFATTQSGAGGTIQYSLDGANWAAGNSVTLFSGNTTTATLIVKETAGGSTSEITQTYTFKRLPNVPVFNRADGAFIDADDTVTISANDGSEANSSTVYYSTDGSSYSQYSAAFTPFTGQNPDTAGSVTYYAKATRNGAESEVVSITVNYLRRPVINKSGSAIVNNTELTSTDTLTLASANTGSNGTLQYNISADGGTTWDGWQDYSSAITPFAMQSYLDDLKLTIKAREVVNNNTVSAETSEFTLLRKGQPYSMYWITDSSEQPNPNTPSTSSFDANGKFFIQDSIASSFSGRTIYYTVTLDGQLETSGNSPVYHEYNINNGIDSDNLNNLPAYQDHIAVTFNFYVIADNTKTAIAKGTFVTVDYDEFIFHESFDGASKSSSTVLALSGSNGTATARTADSFSIEEGAGFIDGNNNSPDWRNNVLRLDGTVAGGTGAAAMTLSTNPFATAGASTMARNTGITVSFWRYVPGTKDSSFGDFWTPGITFSQDNTHYYTITSAAYVSRSDGAVDGNNDYNKYVDIKPNEQDNTGHATGNRRNRWVNIVVTVDPSKATNSVMIYTNGEPHTVTVTAGAGGTQGNYTGNDAALAADIIDFVTNGNTQLSIANGLGYWATSSDIYFDDVRLYTGVKTQVDINNMYIGDDADVQSEFTSTSHDPTNVSVYTLAGGISYTVPAEVSGGAGTAKTTTAGQKVGQEFIDYYGIDATDTTKVTAIDYYSFGTGMTIYHYNATNRKWEVVGDSEGRCGYQNEDLFGAEYHTALATPLAYAARDTRTGAGHLQWAPHVMYNIVKDNWMYYGSTSSWGSQTSAIFVCENVTNDSVTGPYTFSLDVYESNSHPNAIDACVYYEYTQQGGVYKPNPYGLKFIFGSWSSGNTCIVGYNLDSTGRYYSGTRKDVCYPINNTLEYASDPTSGEGAYVTFDKTTGKYYLYVSYGQNSGSYVERVFMSDSPMSGFVGFNGVAATDDTTHKTHGNQILGSFDLPAYDYTFVSTGHNSVYQAVNNYGEVVTLNSVHGRPIANQGHDWKALPDGALATCQSEVDGNVNLINQIAYTEDGWPVMMPFQYDGTDTVKATITATDLEGVYVANDMQLTEYYNWSENYKYTIIADEEDSTNTGAYEYGTDNDGYTFKGYIKLTKGADGTQYATWYKSKVAYNQYLRNPDPELIDYIGVIGKHGSIICIAEICTTLDEPEYYGEYSWTYRAGEIPKSADVESLGNSVSMDGVIYTHLAKDSYTKYGHEISDNFTYGQSGSTGERYTSITTTYPAKIDVTNPTAIYCLSDEALCKTGDYSGGEFSVIPLNNNRWFDGTNYYTDDQAKAAVQAGTVQADNLHRVYGLEGYVSDYYFNAETGEYADSGVSLIVCYTDISTGAQYSEFEFCYVMANPSMAHTVIGTRNKDNSGTEDRRGGIALFTRMEGSEGSATSIEPAAKKVNSTVNWENETSEYFGTGNFNYLYQFPGTADSRDDSHYTGAENIKNSFTYYTSKVGTNSGSFGLVEHYDSGSTADSNKGVYTASANIVNADYYIDYSDEDNTLITRNGSGAPTGYSFNFYASNLYWSHPQNAKGYDGKTQDEGISRATSYVSNRTGLSMPTSVAPIISHPNGNDPSAATYYSSTKSSNIYYYIRANQIRNSGNNTDPDKFGVSTTWLLNDQTGGTYDTILSTMTSDGSTDKSKLSEGFIYVDTASNETSGWQGRLAFTGTGFQNVTKASGNTAATAYNFAYEQGVKVFRWWGLFDTTAGAISEETFHYYNIGVSTCDKGAARAFAENYMKKRLQTTEDPVTHEHTVIVDQSTGAPIYLDADGEPTTDVTEADVINAQDYTVKSYQAYIDAIAELNWFVENPRNTTFKDYKNSGYNTSEKYITGYTNGGEPIYINSTSGRDVFGTANKNTDVVQAKLIQNVIDAYEELFSVTDYTEAEEAYGAIELLDGDTETTTIADVDTIKVYEDATKEEVAAEFDDENYTDDSWTNFVTLVLSVSGAFDYDDQDSHGSHEKSWRNVNLTAEEYRTLRNILGNAQSSLMPKVDTVDLDTLLTDKKADRDGGIFTGTGGAQEYTLDSWLKINTRIPVAEALKTPTGHDEQAVYTPVEGGEDVYFQVGKFDVTGVDEYEFDDVVFYSQVFNAADFDRTNYTDAGKSPSDAQRAVYAELNLDASGNVSGGTNANVLGGMNLVSLDTVSAYQSYDAAYGVISASINYDKYVGGTSGAAHTAITTELAKQTSEYSASGNSTVYITPTAAVVSAYNAAVTGGSISTSSQLKNLGLNQVDAYTTSLLTVANTLNDVTQGYVKQFTGTVQVTDYEGTPIEGYESPVALTNTARGGNIFYYGDIYNVAIPEAAQGKCEISVTYKDHYDNNRTVGSQKVSYNGSSFTKNAISDMVVTIRITDQAPASNTYKVQIKNMYYAVVDTIYVSEENLNSAMAASDWATNKTLNFTSTTVTAPYVPFYTFTQWKVSINSADKTATFKPYYNAGDSVTLNVNDVDGGATTTVTGAAYDSTEEAYVAAFDNRVTLTNADAYGWATVLGDKYQIAAYGTSMTLNAVTEETFYPITVDGGEYYANGDKLTASNVDVKFSVEGVDADSLLNQKLAAKNPFVSIIATDGDTNANNKLSSATVYCRVTTGATSYTDIGSMATTYTDRATDSNMVVGNNVQVFKTSTVRPTGQYSYTISSSGSGFAQVYFRAYIAYGLTYSYIDHEGASHTATLNVSEYSKTIMTQTPESA